MGWNGLGWEEWVRLCCRTPQNIHGDVIEAGHSHPHGGGWLVPSWAVPWCPGEAVAQLCTSEESCEVDPSRCGGLDLSDNQKNLKQVCEETFQRIAASCE